MNESPSSTLTATDRTGLRRMPNRGVFDRDAILPDPRRRLLLPRRVRRRRPALCHPHGYARVGDAIPARFGSGLGTGIPVCVTVTLVDGLVLAHRSVVLLGQARPVTDPPIAATIREAPSVGEHVHAVFWWPRELDSSLTKSPPDASRIAWNSRSWLLTPVAPVSRCVSSCCSCCRWWFPAPWLVGLGVRIIVQQEELADKHAADQRRLAQTSSNVRWRHG